MTKEELDKMTPEEKRVRIAEICGWTGTLHDEGTAWGMAPETMVILRSAAEHPFKCLFELPDYLNDLNAMAEAEKSLLKDGQLSQKSFMYAQHLIRMNGGCQDGTPLHGPMWKILTSSSEMRADAFLLTIG